MSGIFLVLEAPSIGRRSLINDRPASLISARRVLYSFAARLEATETVHDLEPDYYLSDSGAIFEGFRWRVVECDGVHECAMAAYLTDDPGADLLAEVVDDEP